MEENISSQVSTDEDTEIISQDNDALFMSQTSSQFNTSSISPSGKMQSRKGQEEVSEESNDPDVTFANEHSICGNPNISEKSEDESGHSNDNNVVSVQSGLSNDCSQQSTQPISQSQDFSESPPDKAECKSKTSSIDETFELMPYQDIQNTPSPPELKEHNDHLELQTFSRASTLEVKPSGDLAGHCEDNLSSLHTASSAVASSSSSSQIVSSSSSSSKRATESDDTDEIAHGSQDMFESQGSTRSPSGNVSSVSQFVPTLQLSGDIPLSQGYERFLPSRLCPSSPTSGLTSTPIRQIPKPSGSNGEVISLSDEEDVMKLSEKRKLSGSSDETKPVKRSKTGFNNRQSIEVLGEIHSFKKPSLVEQEDLTVGSQGFSLHFSPSEGETAHSQGTEVASPLNNSWRSHTRSGNDGNSQPSTTLASTAEHDISVVDIDDVEDEIQFVSPQAAKSCTVGEITLDSSGHADIEVLSPLEKSLNSNRNKNFNVVHDGSLPSQKKLENQNSSSQHKPLGGNVAHALDSSKENIQPGKASNLQDYENEFVMTFTCSFKVTCKASIDTIKKETASRCIPTFEILESRTVLKRDSSPSAVEESSPGRGCGSPGSVASGPGPFKLLPSHAARLSMISTTSSSSAGSAASIYRQVAARRGRTPAQVPHWPGKTSTVKPEGLAMWRELLNQRQDELAASVAPHLERWEASTLHNSSSDESKIIGEDKVLDTVPEIDDLEEVLGIPPSKGKPKLLLKKKLESSSNSSSAPTLVKTEQNPPDTEPVVKSECDTPPSNKRKKGRPARTATPRTPIRSLKKKAPTPQKKNPDMPSVGEHSSMPDDSLSSGSCYFTPGSQVFAQWCRGEYYPGLLGITSRPNQWNVIFHDGKKKELSKNDIHLISTFEIGQSVCAMNNGVYEKGEVNDVIPAKDEQDELYKIKLVSGTTVTVPLSDLCLKEGQIQLIMGELPASSNSNSSSSPTKRTSASKLSNIDLDNILPGKRVRTPKASQSVINSPGRPGPSNTARRLIADSCGSSTAEDEPLAINLMNLPTITGVQPEQVGFEKTADPLARKGKGVKKSASKKPLPDIDDEKIVQELGPIPPEGSRLFAGNTFLLTVTDAPRHRHELVTDSERNATDVEEHQDDEGGHCFSDLECYEFTKARMVKDRLMRQIIQGGGKVLKHWNEIMTKDIKRTYVVSNRPCSTAIFIQCLVRGVRGVNHDYIIYCCKENERFASGLQRNYLPVGYSRIKRDWKGWHEHNTKIPLQGENILIDGEKSFKGFWEEVLKHAGANVSTVKGIEGDFSRLTKVLSEKHCLEQTLKQARYWKIPVVSPMWVIQSLVENTSLEPTDLQCFAFNHVDDD